MKTTTLTIQVKPGSGDTYVARVLTKNVTASCTMGPEEAAKAVAKKYADSLPYACEYAVNPVRNVRPWPVNHYHLTIRRT